MLRPGVQRPRLAARPLVSQLQVQGLLPFQIGRRSQDGVGLEFHAQGDAAHPSDQQVDQVATRPRVLHGLRPGRSSGAAVAWRRAGEVAERMREREPRGQSYGGGERTWRSLDKGTGRQA